jgi:hypothetical protein
LSGQVTAPARTVGVVPPQSYGDLPEITLKLVAVIVAGHDYGHMNDKTSISVFRSSLVRGAILTLASCAAALAVAQGQAMAKPPLPSIAPEAAAPVYTCHACLSSWHIGDLLAVLGKPMPQPPTGPLIPTLPDRMLKEIAIPGAQVFGR